MHCSPDGADTGRSGSNIDGSNGDNPSNTGNPLPHAKLRLDSLDVRGVADLGCSDTRWTGDCNDANSTSDDDNAKSAAAKSAAAEADLLAPSIVSSSTTRIANTTNPGNTAKAGFDLEYPCKVRPI